MRLIDGQLRVSASDLSNFLACRHLTRLDTLLAKDLLQPVKAYDVGFQELVRRGEQHERNVLDQFRLAGLDVVEIPCSSDTAAIKVTRDALRSGVAVIFQGVLQAEATGTAASPLLGRPDFLIRSDVLPQSEGDHQEVAHHYEVVDAKLARTAKARAVLQVAFYSALLDNTQGAAPNRMHLALGDGEFSSFRVADYASYERRVRLLLQEFLNGDPEINPPADPYPEPVEHCAICRWSVNCNDRRRSDDDLSLIAGMATGQRLALKAVGVSTRRDFAGLAELPALERGDPSSVARAQLQARLQVASEDAGTIEYQLLEPDRDAHGGLVPNRGLLALPEPSAGDLFFDIEGARYYTEDGKEFGLQYLFGIVDTADTDEDGAARYTQIWAFDRRGEKRAFQELIDFITERLRRNPRLHVYHYNHYEPTSIDHLTALHQTREEAVGRLMGRFGTHEDEVDDLFRLGVFVDLYRVVRQGIRAGVESYSIKRLEPLVGYERLVDLRDATAYLIAFDADLEEGTAEQNVEGQRGVAGYNEDDCRATLVLRDWLEERRAELAASVGTDLPRPVVEEEAHGVQDPEVARLKTQLLEGIPEDIERRSQEENAKALLADLLEWHRREAKPAWWQYFRRKELSSPDLVGEREAIGELTGGEVIGHIKQSVVRRFYFPEQEHGFGPNDKAQDPVSDKNWTVEAIDEEKGTIDLKVRKGTDDVLPAAIIEGGPINTTMLSDRLRDLGKRAVQNGVDGSDPATALLLRRRPTGDSRAAGELRNDGEASGVAATRLILGLRSSYLPIQGPPGTGKTFTGAEAILALTGTERTVGITAPSHAVICNLLDAVVAMASECGRSLRIAQHADKDGRYGHYAADCLDYPAIITGLDNNEFDVVAGTAWMWARPEFADAVDTLFVDEAGQLSLANTLAVAGGARNLVLLGDPQQLAQPSQAAHPPGAGASALEQVLDGNVTMPEGAGLFLDRTYRMHPRLCEYTSEVFYDGRLDGLADLIKQRVHGGDRLPKESGLHVIEVAHDGNTNASPEEAREVVQLVRRLLTSSWTDRFGYTSAMAPELILVVTPYNAQIREIERALSHAAIDGVQVGTVDKFQGREAPAVIYSMATSSAADAPRGLEFLFDLHRLNVASSRARAITFIVASPDLMRMFCSTPRQMQLVNALCRAWEW
jgi:predicted RecB family nuclease